MSLCSKCTPAARLDRDGYCPACGSVPAARDRLPAETIAERMEADRRHIPSRHVGRIADYTGPWKKAK